MAINHSGLDACWSSSEQKLAATWGVLVVLFSCRFGRHRFKWKTGHRREMEKSEHEILRSEDWLRQTIWRGFIDTKLKLVFSHSRMALNERLFVVGRNVAYLQFLVSSLKRSFGKKNLSPLSTLYFLPKTIRKPFSGVKPHRTLFTFAKRSWSPE